MMEETNPQGLLGHLAVNMEHYILVISIKLQAEAEPLPHVIWMYNIYTEKWTKHVIPSGNKTPAFTVGACASLIGSDVYTFGGADMVEKRLTNAVWKLTCTTDNKFDWSQVSPTSNKNIPSPRSFYTGWEYAGQLWIFGGDDIEPLFDETTFLWLRGGCNNELFVFDPSCNDWTKTKQVGSVPENRSMHATSRLGDFVWLYGGQNYFDELLDDLY